MRDRLGRWILTAFAGAAVVLGVLVLFGITPVHGRGLSLLIAIILIGNGVGLLRFLLSERAA